MSVIATTFKSNTDHQPMCTDVFRSFGDVNCGCPSLFTLGGGVDETLDIACSSDSCSSDAIMIDCEAGVLGVVGIAAPENGSGCSEQTSLASTATDRNNAQKI